MTKGEMKTNTWLFSFYLPNDNFCDALQELHKTYRLFVKHVPKDIKFIDSFMYCKIANRDLLKRSRYTLRLLFSHKL